MENLKLCQASTDDLPGIATVKSAMFADAGLAESPADNAVHLVKRTYRVLYAQGLAAHVVASERGEILAMAGAAPR